MPSGPVDIEVLWRSFRLTYDRRYATDEEEAYRLSIFTANMYAADSPAEEMTRFSDLTDAEVAERIAQAKAARSRPALYQGPSADVLINPADRIELANAGLALEVANSLIPNAGRGLFVRLLDGFESVSLDANTIFCGYATGKMLRGHTGEKVEGTTVAFNLTEPETAVLFEDRVWSVRELLGARERERFDRIAGHVSVHDQATGALLRIELDPAYEGPKYFVPMEQPSPLTWEALGHIANDFAGGVGHLERGADGVSYLERTTESNLLVLMQRLERDLEAPGTLRPSPPVLTLKRAVTFGNRAPMELGNEYGAPYWDAERERSAGAAQDAAG